MGVLVVFDIDGVLIDSYKGIPIFYREVLPDIKGFNEVDGEVLYRYELYAEGLGFLRIDWWPRVMPWLTREKLLELLEKYWEVRHGYSRLMPGTHWLLEKLNSEGFIVSSVSYKDDLPGYKVKRIRDFGLDNYLRDILIVDKDAPTRLAGILSLMNKYSVNTAYYIDDKPGALWKIKRADKRIVTILYRFPYEEEFPWSGINAGDYVVYSLPELYNLLESITWNR